MSIEVLALRLVHILGGIFWLGAGVFSSVFLLPSLTAARVNPGPLFAELERRRYFTVLPVVAILTMLSGARLLAIASGGFQSSYFATGQGLAYATGAVLSLLTFTLALAVSRPSNARAAALQESLGAVAAERQTEVQQRIATLRRRGAVATTIAVVMLTASGALMAVARYL